MRMRCLLLTLLVLALPTGTRAQDATTPDWPAMVTQFAASADSPASMLATGCSIQTFRDDRLQLANELALTLGGTRLISAHAYDRNGGTIASDLGRALVASGAVGPVVDDLMPDGVNADVVAARWIQQQLKPAQGHRVAVLAFAKESGSARSDIVLVLVRGVSTAEGFSIDRIRYGTPVDAAP